MTQFCKTPYEDLSDSIVEILTCREEAFLKTSLLADGWQSSYVSHGKTLATSSGHLTEHTAKTSCSIKALKLLLLA